MPDDTRAQAHGTTRRKKVLWASTAARGGIATFVSTMQTTTLWQEWNVHVVTTHTNGPAITRILLFVRALATFLTEVLFHRPQVVHLHTAAYGSFVRKGVIGWIARFFRLPIILHMHGADFMSFFYDAPRPFQVLIRLTLERADALVALGDAWADQLSVIAPLAKIVVVPNAVNPVAPVDQHVAGPINVVFLGEIGHRKGTFTLLDAWAKMIADVEGPSRARLTIIGDGEVERARQKVADLRVVASVEVHGWMAHTEVKEVLAQSQILVLPSRDEGQPMAILEAMARGLCVVASTVGGIPEILSDGCGVLVSPDDVDELANGMAHVITDHHARASYGSKGLQRIRDRFDVAVVSQRFDALYRQLS